MQRSKELAAVQADIWANQAELEEARKKQAHSTDLAALRERSRVEEDIFNAALRQRRAKQILDLQHQLVPWSLFYPLLAIFGLSCSCMLPRHWSNFALYGNY